MRRLSIASSAAALAIVAWAGGPARAQEVDIEVPVVVLEEVGDTTAVDGGEIDLANIVQTAARAVTTVQEAPAIVTVITAEDIELRGWTAVEEMADSVPGYLRLGAIHNQFSFPLTRGILQSVMYMSNGVSLFDSNFNVPTVHRLYPIETIKRAEFITGPGGVLWGANSLLGILNVITKDADDVDGVEGNVGIGHGNGDREYMRGYVMAGIPELWSDSSKLFLHTSFETYVGPGYQMPFHMFSQPLPNPNSQVIYGPLVTANPPRSFMFNFDGKLSMGKLDILFSVPFVERHLPLGFPGFVTQKDRAEDDAVLCTNGPDLDMDGNPDTTAAPPGQCPAGFTETSEQACPNEPGPDDDFFADDFCLDRGKVGRDNRGDWLDRYLIADYRTRLAEGKAGVGLKAYFVQFQRNFNHLGILAPIAGLLEGGLAFSADGTNYRAGGNFDGDVDLPGDIRMLYGAEAFHEWFPNRVERSRQGEGIESVFAGPYQLVRLPLLCPRTLARDEDGNFIPGEAVFVPNCPLTFSFTSSRTVLGAYVNPQWKLTRTLTLDAGARVQVAPEALGKLSYPLEPLFGGAIVSKLPGWLPGGDWHGKINYTMGLRPPVFNNLNSNGDSVQIDGRPDLEVERSRAIQGEINARLFKGERRVRELNFRADYSYTQLENLIQVVGGRYENTADRDMHSVEFLGRLYVQGGHQVQLGYTWLRMAMADKGMHRSMPEHWFNLTGIFAVADSLMVSTNLRVLGAMEDPNRIVEWRDYQLNELDRPCVPQGDGSCREQNLVTMPHEMTLDRLPAVADLTAGLIYQPTRRLEVRAFAYNLLNERYYQPDAFFDYEPRLEFLPNPAQDLRFKVHATYTY